MSRKTVTARLARAHSPRRWCLTGSLGVVLLVVVPFAPVCADIVGSARIVDGDTIEIGTRRIRLGGIDAPESHQYCELAGTEYPCGVMASAWLVDKTLGKKIRCRGRGRDRYNRLLAVCYAGAENINASLVRSGWALAFRRYSDEFVTTEAVAKRAKRGLWAGRFVTPWEWRRGVRLAALRRDDQGCQVKGNVTSRGKRVYHLPGGGYYAKLRLHAGEGDRCFHSESEAIAAGFRRSAR